MITRRTLIAALAAALVTPPAWAKKNKRSRYNGLEVQPYTVVETDGGFELRDYQPHLVAEVQATGGRSQAATSAFRKLFAFITGKNADAEEIAMTVPVVQSPVASDESSWTVRFVLPARFSPETTPGPDDPDIRITEEPGGRFLAVTFAGIANQAALENRKAELATYASTRGLSLEGPPIYLFYNDPFTLPWKRRNEVAYRVGEGV